MNQQTLKTKNILNRMVVQEALKRSQDMDMRSGLNQKKPVNGQDTVISLLIHDIFGGEILKTHNKKGWHFYNRIDGERVDFQNPKIVNLLMLITSKIFRQLLMRPANILKGKTIQHFS